MKNESKKLSIALDFDEFSTGNASLRALMHIQNTPGAAGSGKITEAVPEPVSLLGIAALGLGLRRRVLR